MLQALCFAHVAQNPDITVSELHRALGSSDSVVSRIVAILSDIGNRGTPGLGLVDMRVDPSDHRVRRMSLTAKGHRLWDDIASDLKPNGA